MTDPEDDKHMDFAARAFECRGRAEVHRLRAEMVDDQRTKAIHANAAASYDRLAIELDMTAKAVADIDRTTARVRARISALGKSQSAAGGRPEPARD
jgi:hypothetical protein